MIFIACKYKNGRWLFTDKLCFVFLLLWAASCKVTSPTSTQGATTDQVQVQLNRDTSAIAYISQPVYHASPPRIHDLQHTRLEVQFDWENRQLIGNALLELKPYFYPQSTLTLDAKRMEINSVLLIDGKDKIKLDYEYDGEVLSILLDREYTREENFFLEIDYLAKPYDREAGGSKAIASDRGLYFINPQSKDPDKPRQIWTQGETESNSHWFPTIDKPNERTTQEIYITVDSSFTTLSNGVLIYTRQNSDGSRTDYWKLEQPHAPYLFMMAIGDFAKVSDSWRNQKTEKNIEVSYLVEPGYKDHAKTIFGATPEMLTFFSDLLEYPYPWPKYSQVVVRDYVSGAMENTTASVFMEDLQMTGRELIDHSWDYIIAHELFHHWFGDLVTTESWSNLTLNEAFANYAEYLWLEYKYGKEEADFHQLEELETYLKESEEKQVDLIRFDYEYRDDMFDQHSYAKGGWIIHMLRSLVGEEAFFLSLNHYLRKHEYSSVEAHDLRLAFEEIVGEDLNWFFNQWFFASGHPVLKIEHEHEDGKLVLKILQAQDLNTTPLYRLPVYVDVWHGDSSESYAIELEDQYEEFELEIERIPDLVVFDPQQQLLAEIEHLKAAKELAFQYRHAKDFAPRYETVVIFGENAQDSLKRHVLLEAFEDQFWGIRQIAVEAFYEYQGKDVTMVAEALAEVVRNDEKSLVRSSALDVLSSLDSLEKANYFSLFEESLKDSSYAVIGSAIAAILESETPGKEKVIAKYSDHTNINILLPLADHFAKNRVIDRFDWFMEKQRSLKGINMWYFLQYFIELSIFLPEDTQVQAVERLVNLAKDHDKYFIRLLAFQGLNLHAEKEGVKEAIEEIKALEEDERLQSIYQQLN